MAALAAAVPPAGLEPATRCLEGSRSIQLSYRGGRPRLRNRTGAGSDSGGDRRRVCNAGDNCVVAVAQVVRAPGCGPGGRGFKSPRSPSPAPLAQLAEQRTLNPRVQGSSPWGRTDLRSQDIGDRCRETSWTSAPRHPLVTRVGLEGELSISSPSSLAGLGDDEAPPDHDRQIALVDGTGSWPRARCQRMVAAPPSRLSSLSCLRRTRISSSISGLTPTTGHSQIGAQFGEGSASSSSSKNSSVHGAAGRRHRRHRRGELFVPPSPRDGHTQDDPPGGPSGQVAAGRGR